MNFDANKPLDIILKALFDPYKASVKDVKDITQAMLKEGLIKDESEIINDHIAFRTLGVPNLGIASLEKIFLSYGYIKKDAYFFEEKKLDANWYAPPSPDYPRIFISELRVKDLSKDTQNIIHKYTNQITTDPVDKLDFKKPSMVGDFFYKPLWQAPTIEEYVQLGKESEYAAWVIYNRYYLNHYTISVHALPTPYNKLESFNQFLEANGIVLNTSGGKIKTSADGLLRQTSSVAKMITATFADNTEMKIAGSYVEFAERSPLPQFADLPVSELKAEHRREGFEAGNADKIFESTYTEQTNKN